LADRLAVCLHGLLRTGRSMGTMRGALLAQGYSAVDAPTLQYAVGPINDHAKRAADVIHELSRRHGGAQVDVVTHSMGGIVLRAAMDQDLPLRRVVMLSPPNQGAELAAGVRAALPVHHLGWDPLGPLLPGVPSLLPPGRAPIEIGILTGGTGDVRGFAPWLTGDNDGKVRVEEAALDGAADFRVVPFRHTFILARPHVVSLVLSFLQTGRFTSDADGS
jgi:triacylglycerol lipase